MKHLFTILCFVILSASCSAQFAVLGGDTIIVTGTSSPSFTTFGRGYCKNNGPDTITLSWQLISDSAATGWSYTGYCDKNLCYLPSIGTVHSFILAPGASGVLQLDLISGCNNGEGYAKILLWNKNDSANTAQVVSDFVTITTGPTCTNGISEVEGTQVSFYPNPVRNELRLTLSQNINNGQIDIYNLIGSKVYSQPISSRETTKDFDLTMLDTGIYVARISDNGRIIATRKFTKED